MKLKKDVENKKLLLQTVDCCPVIRNFSRHCTIECYRLWRHIALRTVAPPPPICRLIDISGQKYALYINFLVSDKCPCPSLKRVRGIIVPLPACLSIASASVHTNTRHVIRAKNHRYRVDPIMQVAEAVGGRRSHNKKLVKL